MPCNDFCVQGDIAVVVVGVGFNRANVDGRGSWHWRWCHLLALWWCCWSRLTSLWCKCWFKWVAHALVLALVRTTRSAQTQHSPATYAYVVQMHPPIHTSIAAISTAKPRGTTTATQWTPQPPTTTPTPPTSPPTPKGWLPLCGLVLCVPSLWWCTLICTWLLLLVLVGDTSCSALLYREPVWTGQS